MMLSMLLKLPKNWKKQLDKKTKFKMEEEDPILMMFYNQNQKLMKISRNSRIKGSIFLMKIKRSDLYSLLKNRKPSDVAEEMINNLKTA